MLDQLVESRDTSSDSRNKNRLLLVSFILMLSFMMGAWLYSLFAKDYGMGGSDLELSSLVAPVPVPEEAPAPEPEAKPQPKNQEVAQNVDIRKEIIQNIMESPKDVPDKPQTTKSLIPARREGVKTIQGTENSSARDPLSNDADDSLVSTSKTGTGPTGNGPGGTTAAKTPPPPPPSKTPTPEPKETPKPKPQTVSGGVLNGKATSLPKPAYPPAARAVKASGAVSVQVMIDESGKVVSASAASGHPLLRQAAVQAAYGARFSPTMLSGQAVKVTGVITYNFVP